MFEIERLPVTGNSMDLAGIRHGDVIEVRAQDTAPHGAVVVALLEDDHYTVKRLAVVRPPGRRPQYWLVPESTDSSLRPRRLARGESIVGVVPSIPLRDLSDRIPHQRSRPAPAPLGPEQRPGNRSWLETLHRRNVWPVLSCTFAPPKPVPAPAPPRPEPRPYQVWRDNPMLPITPAPYRPRGYISVWMEPELMPDHERTPPLARLMEDLMDSAAGFPQPELERALGFERGDMDRFYMGYVPPWKDLERFARRLEHGFALSIIGGLDTLHGIATGRHR